MTHWIALMQIDTSEKKIIEVAAQNFGESYAKEMQSNMDRMDVSQKNAYVQDMAR